MGKFIKHILAIVFAAVGTGALMVAISIVVQEPGPIVSLPGAVAGGSMLAAYLLIRG
jgi:hypothetical protein